MVETVYNSDDVFREAFAVFNSMRESSEHIDLVLRGDGEADLEAPGGLPRPLRDAPRGPWSLPRTLREAPGQAAGSFRDSRKAAGGSGRLREAKRGSGTDRTSPPKHSNGHERGREGSTRGDNGLI